NPPRHRWRPARPVRNLGASLRGSVAAPARDALPHCGIAYHRGRRRAAAGACRRHPLWRTAMRAALALLLALAAVVPALPAAAQVADAEQAGDQLSTDFYEGRTDGIWDRMTPQMQSALRSRENLAASREQIRQQLGVETEVLERTVSSAQGHTVYLRRARFEKLPMVVLVQWAFDAEGKVGGFFIRPEQSEPPAPAPSKYLDYQTRADLRLPFEDEFFVVWGGRSLEQNRHAADANQRFALD